MQNCLVKICNSFPAVVLSETMQDKIMPVSISLVVPTFNSEKYIEASLAVMISALADSEGPVEIIVVDDGSSDGTWSVLKNFARYLTSCNLAAVRLETNSGQHAATLCGMRLSRGSVVVTIDDDLQNNPLEILPAIAKLNVLLPEALIVAYESQQKSLVRTLGSRLNRAIVQFAIGKSPDLKLSPFRIITRPMIDQICRSTNPQPYITGELLRASGSIKNIAGIHQARISEKSRYGFVRLMKLLVRITFGYSTKALTWITGVAFAASSLFLLVAGLISVVALTRSGRVPGWSSQILLISIFACLNFLVLSVLGAYLRQMILRVSAPEPYSVIESTRQSD